jgi:predicted transposase/invertase (TIGR01784 family)
LDEPLLSPLVDFLFKRIFGHDQNRDVLLAFLNGIFENAGDPPMESVEILNPFIDKDDLTDKMSVLDIRARSDRQVSVNIEVQIRNLGDMRARSLYYWAKLYEGQLQEGKTYQTLHPAITINILDFVEIPAQRMHNVFYVRNQDSLVFSNHLALHFLELPKLRSDTDFASKRLYRWLLFLTTTTKPLLEALVKGDPVMEKALDTLKFLSQDAKTREQYEARQKALHDYASAMRYAEDKGREEGLDKGREEGLDKGREEGLDKGRKEGLDKGREEGERRRATASARKMLAAGLDPQRIAEFVDLSLEEVEAMRRSLA